MDRVRPPEGGWTIKRSRFSEEQIIGILREQEAGAATAELCRKHGVSGATFYKWKARYGGLDVSEARRLKALEEENRRLKELLARADVALDEALPRLNETLYATGSDYIIRCDTRWMHRSA